MNEYEMKLNDITRKNIAFTSELSMFRAILFKLEKTKEEKVNFLTYLISFQIFIQKIL